MLKRLIHGFLPLYILMLSGCANPLFFYPDDKGYSLPSDYSLTYEKIEFSSQDGVRLSGWFVPAETETVKGTVIHFHGNAQNMTAHFQYVKWLPKKGFNLFVFDYRGYGASDGKAERKGIYRDCVAAIEWVREKKGVDSSKLILLGQSLGGALAIRVAADHPEFGLRAVVADSPFASYRMITRDKIDSVVLLKWFKWPLSFLLATDTYSPVDTVEQIAPVPLLIIHGTSDAAVPYRHGKTLYEKASEPRYLWTIENGRHTEALLPHRMKIRRQLIDFFDTVLDE